MDVLLSVALQDVAAEGSQGCSLPTLWSALHGPASAAGLPLDLAVKQVLWTSLLGTPCLSFHGPLLEPLPCAPLSVEDAEDVNVVIVGSEELRESYMGIYDYKHCESKLSPEQRMVLERIGQARATGVTQFQLGKEFGMNGKKLFYIIKNLESRGLIIRQSSILRAERPVATNLVHLKQFAKQAQLGFNQRFEIQQIKKDDLEQDIHATNLESSGQEGGLKDLLISNDLPALREICERLEVAENKVLVVSDLKVSLGYRFKTGHRRWRRVLGRLTAAGLVEAFDAKIAHKVLHCIRLIKPFDPKALSCKYNNMNSEESGTSQSFKGVKRGQVTDQVAELSINRQIYDYIKQGGSTGVTVTEIFTNLGLNNRKNYFRLTELVSKHGLRLEAENYKRSTQYRVWAPENAIDDSEYVSSGWKLQRCAKRTLNHEGSRQQIHEPWEIQGSLLPREEVHLPLSAAAMEVGEPSCVRARDMTEDEALVTGLEMVSFEGEQMYQIKEGHNLLVPDSLECAIKPVISTESLPVSFSRSTQRLTPLSSRHTQREVWIMERLERDRFIIRAELHKWLEEMEGRTDVILDRKTVIRNVQKLQHEGRCKCLLVSLPGVTNYGQFRTIEVVLLPSLEVGPEILSEIYERQRAFDILIRSHRSMSKRKSRLGMDIPDLTGLKRMEPQIVDKGGTLHDNGFIHAKMIRCRMLHQFLWSYVRDISGFDGMQADHCSETMEAPSSSGDVIFSLLVAIQSMPLELFLQVIGSSKHIKGLTERCRRGMRLSDLPSKESDALLDANASGRLSWLVDILRRLKLLRIVMIPATAEGSIDKMQQAGVAYCLEQRPYLDEPSPEPPSPLSAHIIQLGPFPRHFFDLSSKEGLEDYWKSLEYYFCAGHASMARRVFPGSTVPELFGPRSWATVRLMTIEQRTELQKRIGVNDSRRLPYMDCVRIAGELNLSLDQVLRVSYEKNQKIKQQEAQRFQDTGSINVAVGHKTLKNQSKRHVSVRESSDSVSMLEIKTKHPLLQQAGMECQQDMPIIVARDACTEKIETDVDADEVRDDLESEFPDHVRVVKRPLRKRKFLWDNNLDRVLIACYTRQRTLLGARHNRVDWNSMEGLPAAPETCRRRIAFLKMIPAVRSGLMNLCNVLGTRYTKALRNQFLNNQSTCVGEMIDEGMAGGTGGFRWDDFNDPSLFSSVDHILKSKNLVRSSVKKKTEHVQPGISSAVVCAGAGDSSEHEQPENCETHGNVGEDMGLAIPAYGDMMSDDLPSSEAQPQALNGQITSLTSRSSGIVRSRPTRIQSFKKVRKPRLPKAVSSNEALRRSPGAATAVELIKLVFLNSAVESEISQVLVDALRRCKESDIFMAFRYLKDQNMVAMEEQSRAFVLSSKFYDNSAASYFSTSIGEECTRFETWVKGQHKSLEEDWVQLSSNKEWGDLLVLFGKILKGELSILPFMPEKGIGEKEKRKRHASTCGAEPPTVKLKTGACTQDGGFRQRRERGFPGIEVKVHINALPLERMLGLECATDLSLEDLYALRKSPPCMPVEGGCLMAEASSPSCEVICSTGITGEYVDFVDLKAPLTTVDDSSLKVAYDAILAAGEGGLKIDELPTLVGFDGKKRFSAEDTAQALCAYGLAKEVMAYDHCRIVSNYYCKRFFLHLPRAERLITGRLEDNDSLSSCKTMALTNESEAVREELCSSSCQLPQLRDIHSEDSVDLIPILPWLGPNGKEDAVLRKAFNRMVMGIVMLNPGIMEDSIIQQLDVLNPTSCQKLLELLVLDGHLFVRIQMEAEASTPLILQTLTGQISRSITYRKHYFANPWSTALL